MPDAEIIHVIFDRHPYNPDAEGYCWECGEERYAHERGNRGTRR